MNELHVMSPEWPTEYVLGSEDLERDAAFLGVFGLEPTRLPDVSTEAADALYGLDGPARQLVMKPVDSPGRLRLVETPYAGEGLRPFDLGPQGLDLNTRDLDLAVSAAEVAGGHPGTPTPYWVHGRMIVECRVLSPGGEFGIHVVQSDHGFPGLLDQQPGRRYSDLATFVLFVDPALRPADLEFWRDQVGLDVQAYGLTFEDGAMGRLMDLPGPARMGSDMYVDADMTRRLELLYYPDHVGNKRPDWPARSGFHGVTLSVVDLDSSMCALSRATFGKPTTVELLEGPTRAVTGTSPAGVRFELHQTVHHQGDSHA